MAKHLEAPTLHALVICQLCHGTHVDPKLLPCLHSLCAPCLDQLFHRYETGEKVQCVQCNMELDKSGGPTYKTNMLSVCLQEENARLLRNTTVQTCTVCTTDGRNKKASFWCSVCHQVFCDNCNKVHAKTMKKDGVHHKVTPMGMLKKRLSVRYCHKKDKEYCDIHPKETFKVYCVQCQEPLCLTCKVTLHDNHQCISIQDAALQFRSEITALLAPLADNMAQVQDTISSWQHYKQQVQCKQLQTKRAVEEYKAELVDMVNKWHSQCLQTLARSIDREMRIIEENSDKAHDLHVALETAQLFGHTIINHGKDGVVATLRKTVIDRLENVQTEEVAKPQDKLDFSLHTLSDLLAGQTLGVIYVEQEGPPHTSSPIVHLSTFTFHTTSPTDTDEPCLTGVAVDSTDSTIIVVDHRNNALKDYTRNGKLKRATYLSDLTKYATFAGPQKAVWDCSVLANADLVLACVDGLFIFNRNKEECISLDSTCEYTSVCVGDGDEVVAFNNTDGSVCVFEESGKCSTRFRVYTKRVLGWASTISTNKAGQIYVVDISQDCVRVYTRHGRHIRNIGQHGKDNGQFIRPRGITTDTKGNILVADKGNHRLQKFSPQGTYMCDMLNRGDGLEAPSGVTLDSEARTIVVTEKGIVHVVEG